MSRAPTAFNWSGVTPFTVACVPTGMNSGVSIVACVSWSRPARAESSVASRSKVNDMRFRIADGGLRLSNPKSAIRNPKWNQSPRSLS